MSTEQLNEVKNEVQKILDHHLPEDQRFSIQDLGEEGTFLLIDLLLEKNDKKRKEIRTKIEKEISLHKMNLNIDHEKIMEIKDKLTCLKNDFNDLDNLKNIVNSDSELDKELENIQI